MKDSWKLINLVKFHPEKAKSAYKSLLCAALSIPPLHKGNIPTTLEIKDLKKWQGFVGTYE